jgi:hypothetical protein
MNDGITRSGSFGPAAELAAAHTEVERLKAWSNEQIAKLNARIAELELALELQKRIAGGFSQALMAAEAEGPDHGEADPDYPPHRYLFEGEPEHCSLCGEAGHTHDDHWLFQHEPVQALVAKLKKLEEPNHDDPLWLRNEVRRLRGVVKGWHDRVEAARGLLQRTFCHLPSGSKIEWAVGLFLADEERADDEWKELDPER